MKILLSWLREFVPFDKEPRELATDLSLLGFAVDAITTEGEETVLDVDVTTNRPDALSHYGMAREVAARYGLPLEIPVLAPGEPSPPEPVRAKTRGRRKDAMVEIESPELCGRYSARLIRGVEVKPSPEWLARRLELVGVRTINNVADATNYVLMAYGHPMHAFDLDRLEGGRILVRRASDGESLKTLDGIDRKLTPEDLVIADARRAVALAGVMGGLDTEISASTKNVLLESAWFDPVAVRRTSKRQGLHTEASHRFERGADIEATVLCADRCIKLIRELAGGQIDPATVDAHPKPLQRHPVLLHRWELSRHLGLEIPPEEVERILYTLGFHPRAKGRTGWICVVPSYRVDITREIDLVEEVVRHYGYERVPLRLPATSGEPSHNAPNAEKEERVRTLLLGLGYDETISNVLVRRATEEFGDAPPVALSNPLSEEAAVLRTSLAPGLLDAVEWNLNRGQDSVRLFEIGKIYLSDDGRYLEPPVAALATTGKLLADNLNDDGSARPPVPYGFLDLKGDIEQLIGMFSFDPSLLRLDALGLPAFYRSGHSARLLLNGKTVARIGALNHLEAGKRKFLQPVYMAEVFLEVLYNCPLRTQSALHALFPLPAPPSRYPAVQRDFSIVLPDRATYETVRQTIDALNITELVGKKPVEIFRGGSIEAGHYSLLLRVTLQSNEATLTEAELTDHSTRIIQALEGTLGAKIRMSG
ncbi:MAG: phenylalanine--tRNA ligase subunit beta [Acidobacteria bacterium]|nr:phenylalanine--tRNA ligase subunit beta [Acidobacteriota bacterium]